MALKFRLCARLDVRNQWLVKPIRYEGVRRVGDPKDYAERYDRECIDELTYLDAVASLYGRNSLFDLVASTNERCLVPLAAGGGIRSVFDGGRLLREGADKIVLNTAATERPGLIDELARKFGSQAVVLQLDAKHKDGRWRVYRNGGREDTGREAVEWSGEAVDRGVGEILCTSIDHEGVCAGFAIDLIGSVSSLPVPVIASGGFGAPLHAVEAYEAGASGVAIATALHYGRVTLSEIREALRHAGIAVRRVA